MTEHADHAAVYPLLSFCKHPAAEERVISVMGPKT